MAVDLSSLLGTREGPMSLSVKAWKAEIPPSCVYPFGLRVFSKSSPVFTVTQRGNQGAEHSPASGPAVRDTSRATAEATPGVAADRDPNGNSHPSGGVDFYDHAPEAHGPTVRSDPFMSPLQVLSFTLHDRRGACVLRPEHLRFWPRSKEVTSSVDLKQELVATALDIR